MSLRPDDRASRNRDRSSTRRDRSRSNVRAISPPRQYDQLPGSFQDSSYELRTPEASKTPYPDDDYEIEPRRRYEDDYALVPRKPSQDDDHSIPRDDRYEDSRQQYDHRGYEERRPNDYRRSSYEDRHTEDSRRKDYGDPRRKEDDSRRKDYEDPRRKNDDSRRKDYEDSRRKNDDPRRRNHEDYDSRREDYDSRREDYDSRRKDSQRKEYDSDSDHSALAYGRSRQTSYQENNQDAYKRGPGYAQQDEYRYAEPPDKIKYTSKPAQERYVEISPDDRIQRAPLSRTTSNSLAPAGLGARMDRLSVSGNRPDMHSITGGRPPASPLLEAYHGTYQSISPMPTAMRLDDDDIPSLDYVQPHSKKEKRVKLYDPEADAKTLAKALTSSTVNAEVICDILPPLSDDQIWELRKEYKKQYKVQGKGVNLSKHLKMKLSGNFGKIVYVTALGRWESEGYWANFFYQSHASRRELLIESLMGRSNADIRSIKQDFKDKRYNDDLVRCMEKELKMDKFRTAILMSLEGRRQEEQDVYPHEYRAKDVEVLQRAVRAREGGESAMLEIVVRRSDAHLRECLRLYESMYGDNFARAALKRSNNLVGEVVAHILNGVINKPARDAILLRHAIKDIANHNKDDELRYELLTSRLVRLHWDRLNMMRVKKEYKDKYGKYLEEDLEASTKGDFRDFVCELCQVQGPK